MSEPQKKQEDEGTAQGAGSAQAPEGERDQSTQSSPPASEAGAEITRLKDQLLRALAEAENTRRRAQKERDDTAKYAVANFAKEMLTVADNFARALEALPSLKTADAGIKNLITGVEATGRQLASTLERFGIKKIEPLGQTFDPNYHRVMMEVDDTEKPPGTIVQVLQPGYIIHDRLLREALVAVAKGARDETHQVDTSA